MNAPQQTELGRLHAGTALMKGPLKDARHLPGEIYTSEGIAALEKARIFTKRWLAIARVEDVPKPGDYVTHTIAGEPVIVSRANETDIAVFRNACLHRGVEVATGSGNTRVHRCPYHSWAYNPAGDLVGAPWAKESGHDLSSYRLAPLKSAVWRGWVFVNFDADAAPFEEFIAPMEDELWYYQTGQCRVAFRKVIDLDCNWKFVMENLLDFYHAMTVHMASFATQYKFRSGDVPMKLLPDGAVNAVFGSDMRENFPFIYPELPWIKGRTDFVSGKAALFPNLNLFVNQESIRTSTFWPIAPGRMRLVMSFLLPEETFKVPDFDIKLEKYRRQIDTIVSEDSAVLLALQRAAGSEGYKPGPMVNMEIGMQHIIRNYLEVMGL